MNEEVKKEEVQQIGVLNKFSLDLILLADNKSYHYLDGLHVTSEFTEVTNGHYAMRISNAKIHSDDYPLGPNGEKIYTKPIDILISTDVVKKLQKGIPTKMSIPILQNAVPGSNTKDDGSTVEFIMFDLVAWSPVIFRPADQKYPDIDKVIPEGQPEMEIGFDPDYMIKICQQFKKNDVRTVKLSLYGAEKSMKMEGRNSDTDQDLLVILMPKSDLK